MSNNSKKSSNNDKMLFEMLEKAGFRQGNIQLEKTRRGRTIAYTFTQTFTRETPSSSTGQNNKEKEGGNKKGGSADHGGGGNDKGSSGPGTGGGTSSGFTSK